MTHQLLINHKTVYDYDAAVPYSLLQLRLMPMDRPINLGFTSCACASSAS